jgi:hypothetical protein
MGQKLGKFRAFLSGGGSSFWGSISDMGEFIPRTIAGFSEKLPGDAKKGNMTSILLLKAQR